VVFIFLLAGLGLKTEEFKKAFQRLRFNIFVQCFSFGVVSSIVYGVSRGLSQSGAISQGLADGMVVCSSLPLTINMVLGAYLTLCIICTYISTFSVAIS
jgi:solute carrier family 10 (sodium/bile acid cotransporter), member 7